MRFFRSLVLFLCVTPHYHLATSTTNFDRQNRYGRQNSTETPSDISTPITFTLDYRSRLQLDKNHGYIRKVPPKLHRSYGVTSQLSRRSVNTNIIKQPSPIPHYAATKRAIAWAWLPPGITTTVLPPSPTWLPPRRMPDSLSLILPKLLSPRNPAVNTTITRIKEYFKTTKDLNRARKAKRPKLLSTPLPDKQETFNGGVRNRWDVNSKYRKARKTIRTPEISMPPIKTKSTEKLHKFNTAGTISAKRQPSFVEKLADQIEADEVERIASEGNNPLKYTVKNGILYKRNKIPVARINLSSMDIPPHTNQRNRKKAHAQTVMGSPLISSQQTALLNSINNAVNLHRKPSVPFSPPTSRSWHEHAQAQSISFDTDNDNHQVAVQPSIVRSNTMLMEDSGGLHSNDIIDNIRDPPPYPFSHCYMNVDGFMCCNRFLESLMRQTYRKLRKAHRFHECSVQKIVNRIQTNCEHVFNTTFETVVGIDDFAIRAHFAGDLMCKIQEGDRFITAYATAMPTRKGVPLDPLHVVTNIEMDLRDKEDLRSNSMGTGIHGVRQLYDSVQRVRIPSVHGSKKRDREDIIPFYEKSREDIENDYDLSS